MSRPEFTVAADVGTANLAVAVYDAGRARLSLVRLHDVRGATPVATAVAVRAVWEAVRAAVPDGARVRCVVENQFMCTRFQAKIVQVGGMCLSEATRLFGPDACSLCNAGDKFAFYGIDVGGKTRGSRKTAAAAFVRQRFLPSCAQDAAVMAEYWARPKKDDMDDAIMMALHTARVPVPVPAPVVAPPAPAVKPAIKPAKKRARAQGPSGSAGVVIDLS
jgi:hypothetical protein